ncbi:MAG: plastocyanin/azurin family copper-binding protein, partial [Moheibacter sp.]
AGLYSCDSSKKESVDTPEESTEQPAEQSTEGTSSTDTATSNELTLSATDDMKFDKTDFTVKAGEEISLTLTNTGTLPVETMGHNVVILDKGADVTEFANASAKSKETNFISDLYVTDVIANTKVLGPGESETIKFTLKEAGDYTFLCTFPGHWVQMKGVKHNKIS